MGLLYLQSRGHERTSLGVSLTLEVRVAEWECGASVAKGQTVPTKNRHNRVRRSHTLTARADYHHHECYNYRMDTNFDIKFYRERWKAVEEIERQELRASTAQTNWRQLNSILRRSIRLGLARGDDDGETEIFNRWAALREPYESA